MQQIIDALLVIVLTKHSREYLELYDPQALAQAIDALKANDPGFEAKLAEARESESMGGEEWRRQIDTALGRKPVYPYSEGPPTEPCPHRTMYDDGTCTVCGTRPVANSKKRQ